MSPQTDSISRTYGGQHALFRLLRCAEWGPELMNLGYFAHRGWIGLPGNLLVSLAQRQRQLIFQALEHLAVRPGDRVIDIACGRGGGAYIVRCATGAGSVLGVDVLAENVQLARHLFPPVPELRFTEGHAQALPVADASIQRALCCEAAFHFPDKARFIAECARVLAPGGRLVVVDFVWQSSEDRQCHAHELACHVREVWQWEDLFTTADYQAAARAAGLELTRTVDWTDHVTRPLLELLQVVIWARERAWSRRLVDRFLPLTRHFSDADWQAIAYSARAHRFLQHRTHYQVLVFDKPPA